MKKIISLIGMVFVLLVIAGCSSNTSQEKNIKISFPNKDEIVKKHDGKIGTYQNISVKNAKGGQFKIESTDGQNFRVAGKLVDHYSADIDNNNRKIYPICGLGDGSYKITVTKDTQSVSKNYKVLTDSSYDKLQK